MWRRLSDRAVEDGPAAGCGHFLSVSGGTERWENSAFYLVLFVSILRLNKSEAEFLSLRIGLCPGHLHTQGIALKSSRFHVLSFQPSVSQKPLLSSSTSLLLFLFVCFNLSLLLKVLEVSLFCLERKAMPSMVLSALPCSLGSVSTNPGCLCSSQIPSNIIIFSFFSFFQLFWLFSERCLT